VCLSGSLNGLDSQFHQVSPTRRSVQTGILIFTMEIFVYRWFLLVLGEIISEHSVIIYWLPLVIWEYQLQLYKHTSNRIFGNCLTRWLSFTYSRWTSYFICFGTLFKIWRSRIAYQSCWVSLTPASYTQNKLNNHNFFESCHFLRATKWVGSASIYINVNMEIFVTHVLCIQ